MLTKSIFTIGLALISLNSYAKPSTIVGKPTTVVVDIPKTEKPTPVIVVPAFPTKNAIVLTKDNFVELFGFIDNVNVNSVIKKLALSTAKTTYLFIESPGGSVAAGYNLIEYLNSTDKNIVCLVKVAISMAHHITLACKNRIGLYSNVMMQHNISGGAQGNPESIASQLEFMKGLETDLIKRAVKRTGISEQTFRDKIRNEFWTSGQESVNKHFLDSLSLVICETSLYQTSSLIAVQGPFGPMLAKLNGCPMIGLDIEVNYAGKQQKQTPTYIEYAKEYLDTL